MRRLRAFAAFWYEFVVGDDFDPSLTKEKQLVKVSASAKKARLCRGSP